MGGPKKRVFFFPASYFWFKRLYLLGATVPPATALELFPTCSRLVWSLHGRDDRLRCCARILVAVQRSWLCVEHQSELQCGVVVMASVPPATQLTRKIIQVIPVAQGGKPHAKAGCNTQTKSITDHRTGKSGKASEGLRSGNALNAAQWHVFQV